MDLSSIIEFLTGQEARSLAMIIVIDVVMSGDNAIIIGLAASGLPPDLRRKAIIFGIALAALIRIAFAVSVVHLLAILGLTLAGGLLLLWVCWRMWQELRRPVESANGAGEPADALEPEDEAEEAAGATDAPSPPKTLRAAMINIIVADVSMSLDNVLAVAGAAKDHVGMLVFGLALSVALMGTIANYVARLLDRYRWVAYIGLAIIAYVAVDMIWRGAQEIHTEVLGAGPIFPALLAAFPG